MQQIHKIYNSDNSLLDSLYGKTYEGGLIFYLNTVNGSGFIAAPTDIEPIQTWNFDDLKIETGASNDALYAGKSNTALIISVQGDGGAAFACDQLSLNGYNDWFLPSRRELDEFYVNLIINPDVDNTGWNSHNRYWSSTESGGSDKDKRDKAHVMNKDNGNSEKKNKWENHIVHPVREYGAAAKSQNFNTEFVVEAVRQQTELAFNHILETIDKERRVHPVIRGHREIELVSRERRSGRRHPTASIVSYTPTVWPNQPVRAALYRAMVASGRARIEQRKYGIRRCQGQACIHASR